MAAEDRFQLIYLNRDRCIHFQIQHVFIQQNVLLHYLGQRGYVFTYVRLFVGLSAGYTKTTERFYKNWMEEGSRDKTIPMNLRAHPDKGTDPKMFPHFL